MTFAALLSTGCGRSFNFAKMPDAAVLQFQGPSSSTTGLFTGQGFEAIRDFDLGKQPFGSTSKSSVYVKNLGDLPAKILKLSVDSPGLFSIQSFCGDTLASRTEPCRVDILYSPNTVGSTPTVLHVTYDDGKSGIKTISLPIMANANNLAFLKFELDTLDVKNNTIGYTISAIFKVLYNGSSLGSSGLSILPAQGVIISDPTDSSFRIDRSAATTCGAVINKDCVIKVNFSPTSTGPKSATFNLNYFNGSQVLAITAKVLGNGTPAVQLANLTANPGAFSSVVVNPPAPVGLSIPVRFTGSVPAEGVVVHPPTVSNFQISTDPSKTTCMAGQIGTPGIINGNCSIYVTFNPTSLSTYTDSITLDYNSNGQAITPSLTIPLSGTGVKPALIGINATSLTFGSLSAYKSSTKSFTLTNSGGVAVSALSAASLTNSTDFTAAFDTGCATLAPAASCALKITFKPKSAAARSSDIAFTYFDGRQTQSVNLSASGTGTSPVVVEHSSGSADFGNVMIGASVPSPKSVALGVFGTTLISTASQFTVSPATLSAPFTFPGGSFPGTGRNCKAPLNPNASNSCNFDVGLTTTTGYPADIAVSQKFTIAYSGDGGNGSGSLEYTAKMTPRVPPVLAFTTPPSTLATLSVKNSGTTQFKITNASAYFATSFKSISVSGSSAFSIPSGGNGCSGGLAANASCTITVKFNPTATGTFNGTLSYTYNNQISDQTISTSFSAEGSADVTLVGTPTVIDFGTVYVGDTVTPKKVSLEYFGLSTWTSVSVPSSPFTLDQSACGTAANCQLSFGLNTSAPVTANSTFNYVYIPALPDNTGLNIQLKAVIKHRAPVLGLSGGTFPKTLLGNQVTQTLTLENSGSGAASNLSFPTSLNAPFSYAPGGSPGSAGSCAQSQTLGAGQSCSLKITFAPSQVGSAQFSLDVGFATASHPNSTFSSTVAGIGTQMIRVFAGGYQTCIINEVGKALCWGRNSTGQLGQGNTNSLNTKAQLLTPISFGPDVEVIQLAVGDSHTCAIIDTPSGDGQVSCWGNNESGRLGLGNSTAQTTSPLDSSGRLQVVNLGKDSSAQNEVAVSIAAGFEHTCAILRSGKLKCWGGNTSGQLGLGHQSSIGGSASQMGNSLLAVDLNGATPTTVSAGAGHTCVTLSDGGARCWGDNFYGQLGQAVSTSQLGIRSTDMDALKNISLGTGQNATAISASVGAFTCALLSSGNVKCFGSTAHGSTNPFFGVLGTCWARNTYNSPATSCWNNPGASPSNSIGYYSSDMGDHLPVVAMGSQSVHQLVSGAQFSCVIASDKSVRCWGVNDRGQLGIGSTANIGAGQNDMGDHLKAAYTPSGGLEPLSLSAGYSHVCAVLNNNTLKCWGAYTENATGLVPLGFAGDTGSTSDTMLTLLPVVYDGTK